LVPLIEENSGVAAPVATPAPEDPFAGLDYAFKTVANGGFPICNFLNGFLLIDVHYRCRDW
jgi:hypothetical protein